MNMHIQVDPVHQTGHNCKSTAIASVDKYFGTKLGFQPIPLHKNKTAPISIRELAKSKGSVQGELLELRQLSQIFTDLGYETEEVDFQDHPDVFEEAITQQISKGNLIIGGFAVSRETGQPTDQYEKDNEHAAIINGFDQESGVLSFVHWDQERQTTMDKFYNSSMALLHQRNPEYYQDIKHLNKQKKYDLTPKQENKVLDTPGTKKSIVPQPGSGFRGKFLIIKEPKLEQILQARSVLLNKGQKSELGYAEHAEMPQAKNKELEALFSELKKKTNALIKKGKFYPPYAKVGKEALTLNQQLEKAKKACFDEKIITFVQFKQQCQKAIKDAESEFKKQRGWHNLNSTLKKILGALATATIIPGIAVAVTSKHGYVKTFFQKPPKTGSEEKLKVFSEQINKMKP
jgi:hypothetical protein